MKKLLAALVLMGSSVVMAAESPKIAIADPARIFDSVQELKDLRSTTASEKALLEGVDKEKLTNLKALQEARDALKSDSPQYKEKNDQLLKATIEYRAWGEIRQANFNRDQKLQMKQLYLKIEQAIAEVAKEKGIDLVLTDHRPEIPAEVDRLNMEQLKAVIMQRTVLYAGEKIDLSDEVIARLDSRYRSAAKPQP